MDSENSDVKLVIKVSEAIYDIGVFCLIISCSWLACVVIDAIISR